MRWKVRIRAAESSRTPAFQSFWDVTRLCNAHSPIIGSSVAHRFKIWIFTTWQFPILSYFLSSLVNQFVVECPLWNIGWHGSNPQLFRNTPSDRSRKGHGVLHLVSQVWFSVAFLHRNLEVRWIIPFWGKTAYHHVPNFQLQWHLLVCLFTIECARWQILAD